MTAPRTLKTALTALLLTLIAAPPAWPNGDDFFRGTDSPLSSQLVFVGSVRDDAGRYISGALVTWNAISRDAEQVTSAGTYTDAIGRYRTIDVEHIVRNNGLEFDPARVEINVTKPGYIMVSQFRRTAATKQMGLIEINFILARAGAR